MILSHIMLLQYPTSVVHGMLCDANYGIFIVFSNRDFFESVDSGNILVIDMPKS